jgi:hypothetical protein
MDVKFGIGRSNLTNQIVDGVCIRQGFVAQESVLRSVSIALATYRRKNQGVLFLEIRDIGGEKVAESKVDVEILRDNSAHNFFFNVELVRGRTYELKLHTINCRSGSAVTGKYCRRKGEGHMFIGARLVKNGELSCTFCYDDPAGSDFMREKVEEKMVVLEDGDGFPGLVSVVIPHFNCPVMLTRCLAALTRQTYSGIDVTVVDDGSDKPAYPESVVRSYHPLLSIKFAKLEKNMGAPVARNEGAGMSTGEYLLFLDADCFLYPDAIKVFVETLMENRSAAYAYGGFRWGDEVVNPREFDFDSLKVRNYVTTMSMVRKHEFPGFDPELKRHQDWDLWLTMGKSGKFGACTGDLMFETMKREGGISTEGNIPMGESIAIIKKKHGLR